MTTTEIPSDRLAPPAEDTRPPSIAEWLGGDPYPWPGVDKPAEGARYAGCYCVESKQLLHTKGDKPYLRLQLVDSSGTIEGRVWDDAERIDARISAGSHVGIRGRIQSYRNQRQLKIEEIGPIHVEHSELDLFLPATNLDLDTLETALDQLVASVEERPLRQLLELLTGADTDTGSTFRRAPAAKRNHHAYVGGLLEHTVSIARVADALAKHYGALIDRDLLLTGAILHDIGKIQEIAITGGFPYTDPGKLLGHILLGIEIVRDAARSIEGLSKERLLLVLHLIASHQGKYEWQSPRVPHTLEALILHFADDLDAKVNQAAALVASVEEGWTPYDSNFAREFFRHPGTTASGQSNATERMDAERMDAERMDAEWLEAEYVSPKQVSTEQVNTVLVDVDTKQAPAETIEAERVDSESVRRTPANTARHETAKKGRGAAEEQSAEPAEFQDLAQVSIFDLLS
jgi:3'-5' exoribonuclease